MRKLLITIAILLLSSGCSNKLITVHKLDVQQGNALTEADVNKIKPGMSATQVTQALGHPVLKPAFNKERWDYIYYRKKPYKTPENIQFSVYFNNSTVTRVEKKPSPTK